MVIRPDYIQAIRPFIDQPLVKILAGVRRCGKSTIFEMLADELRNRGIPDERIIQKRYTEMDIPDDISAKDMYDELTDCIRGKGHCYLLLDEIQEVSGWEKCVNSLLEGQDVDIYMTGSNSRLMSSELSTYLTGRLYRSLCIPCRSGSISILKKAIPARKRNCWKNISVSADFRLSRWAAMMSKTHIRS